LPGQGRGAAAPVSGVGTRRFMGRHLGRAAQGRSAGRSLLPAGPPLSGPSLAFVGTQARRGRRGTQSIGQRRSKREIRRGTRGRRMNARLLTPLARREWLTAAYTAACGPLSGPSPANSSVAALAPTYSRAAPRDAGDMVRSHFVMLVHPAPQQSLGTSASRTSRTVSARKVVGNRPKGERPSRA
jgi:hypothetical protein